MQIVYTISMLDLRSEVQEFCTKNGIRLKKQLGQNFLVDQDVLDQIIEASDIEPGQQIIEIGPGIGVLTRELLHAGASVTAIELDRELIPLLSQFVANQKPKTKNQKLTLINGNALTYALPPTPYALIANIPYHITSPLLHKLFLESPLPPTSLTLLIQREVAEKICNASDASLLTVLVGLFGTPRLVTIVPPESFLPPPKVDSAVLHIDCFPEPLADPETLEKVFKLTKIAFSQRRKMLRNTLGAFHGSMERLSALGIDEKRRPQTLSVEEWISIAKIWRENEGDE